MMWPFESMLSTKNLSVSVGMTLWRQGSLYSKITLPHTIDSTRACSPLRPALPDKCKREHPSPRFQRCLGFDAPPRLPVGRNCSCSCSAHSFSVSLPLLST
eukprot:6187807-Pleurochrysis_carterae.AAC.1